MLPNNLDLLDLMILERQQRMQAHMRLQAAGYVNRHPVRRFFGRLMTRGGERLSGEGGHAADVSVDSSLAPVSVLRQPTPFVERKLDRAA